MKIDKKKFSTLFALTSLMGSLLFVNVATTQEIPEEFIKVSMPDFGQHSSGWCWVAAAANSFYWLKHFGGKPDLYNSTWDWGPPGPMQNPVDPLSNDTDPFGLGAGRDGIDNDGDGAIDEDLYDGKDNDLDGMIDEDGLEWYDDMDNWGPGPDSIDNDGDGSIDEDLYDGIDNDGDGRIDEEAAGYFPGGWQPNPGYHTLLKKIAEATFRDINQNGIKDPGEKNYIYSQPVYKWDYVLGLHNFIEQIGADLILHDKIDPVALSPTFEPYPVGPVNPPYPPQYGGGPGGRIDTTDLAPRGINLTNVGILRELGVIVEFSNITFEQYKKAIWCSNDVLLWLRRVDATTGFDHVVTGVGYNQTTFPPAIIYSDPWTHATVPPHDDNCTLPPYLPDHNKDPRHEPWPYDIGQVVSEEPLIFETEDGKRWRVINMIRIYQPPPMYWKPGYDEYAPSGVPDFDQRQANWHVPDPWGGLWWTWCAPTAVANSLWWMDSRFHPSNLTKAYPETLGEHDPSNVVPFINHLGWLMDTDGKRTGIPHKGTWTWDIETGIAQYLSWSGVNPLGDVNGDGTVDMKDWHHVNAIINGSVPFDISGDIWPETVTGPYTADNVVNMSDLWLVGNHTGETGQFYERTIFHMPDFHEVEAEVEKCEDVILVLGFWYYDPIYGWRRADSTETPYSEEGLGHVVTVAGINSTKLKIAISDPGLDAFEARLTPGRSPVSHTHMPPEPPYNTHNNASLVSHDIYDVQFIMGNPAGTWALQGYVGNTSTGAPPMAGYFAVVESAIITSPLPEAEVCGVNITNVVPTYKGVAVNGAFRSWTVTVNVTVHNNGTTLLNCTVNAYFFNATYTEQIGTSKNVTNLPPCNTTTLQFNWTVAGSSANVSSTYTVKANATSECGASDDFINGQVKIRLYADVNDDGSINTLDVKRAKLTLSGWIFDVYADVNGDCTVNSLDVKRAKLTLSGWLDPWTTST